MTTSDATLAPELRSWVPSANMPGIDFPIQNLPFGRFRQPGQGPDEWRIGVAIGDRVLDLQTAGLVDSDDMNALMAAGVGERRALRAEISAGLAAGSRQQERWSGCLRTFRRDKSTQVFSRPTPLLFAGYAVAVAIHLHAWTILEEVGGLGA
ncbi:Uncharacterised protein [Xylophilus ampelinus]|nr:Uncharacterised protein [Xylophilus ampelinus]